MSIGMRTGTMFANGLKIGRFIAGSHCDYVHARQMVNGMHGAAEVAPLRALYHSGSQAWDAFFALST